MVIQIKSYDRLLASLFYLKKPLKLSEEIREKTLNLIW
jgi:hypothetical protein